MKIIVTAPACKSGLSNGAVGGIAAGVWILGVITGWVIRVLRESKSPKFSVMALGEVSGATGHGGSSSTDETGRATWMKKINSMISRRKGA